MRPGLALALRSCKLAAERAQLSVYCLLSWRCCMLLAGLRHHLVQERRQPVNGCVQCTALYTDICGILLCIQVWRLCHPQCSHLPGTGLGDWASKGGSCARCQAAGAGARGSRAAAGRGAAAAAAPAPGGGSQGNRHVAPVQGDAA
jgi:hypothetical protein